MGILVDPILHRHRVPLHLTTGLRQSSNTYSLGSGPSSAPQSAPWHLCLLAHTGISYGARYQIPACQCSSALAVVFSMDTDALADAASTNNSNPFSTPIGAGTMNTAKPAEKRLNIISRMLRERKKKNIHKSYQVGLDALDRAYSNYAIIDPDELSTMTENWKRWVLIQPNSDFLRRLAFEQS